MMAAAAIYQRCLLATCALDMFDSESDISGDNSEDELVEVL